MKIVHFAPFAPNACGLYEAARDMFAADTRARHETYFVDVGVTRDGKHFPGKTGQTDRRGDVILTTSPPDVVYDADIVIAHTGVSDNWIVKCFAPVIWILHGRPLACFRPEQNGSRKSYTLAATVAQWPRVRKMVTFWNHHVPYWNPIVPDGKLVCLDAPPIDERRFAPEGPARDFGVFNGKYNIVIAESWREDVDIYEITHGAIEAAKRIDGLKFHFYAMETPLGCWNYLIDELRKLGAKGEIVGRTVKINDVYRAADLILSPQRIVTRSIGEAMSCGTPVIAARGCDHVPFTAIPDDPADVADTIVRTIQAITEDPHSVAENVKTRASAFSLARYSEQMQPVYESVA